MEGLFGEINHGSFNKGFYLSIKMSSFIYTFIYLSYLFYRFLKYVYGSMYAVLSKSRFSGFKMRTRQCCEEDDLLLWVDWECCLHGYETLRS